MDNLLARLEELEKALKEKKENLKGLKSKDDKDKDELKGKNIDLKGKNINLKGSNSELKGRSANLKKTDLVKALDEAGYRQSALMLKNWNTYDQRAKEFIEKMD